VVGTGEVDVVYNGHCGEAEVLSRGVEDGLKSEAEEESAEDTPLSRAAFRGKSDCEGAISNYC
jgi:hypothetical protein